MTFCASCGRPRNDSARFCGSCGTEFKDSADDQGRSAEDAGHSDAPEGVTRMDMSPEAGPAQSPAETDPFASWYQSAAPAAAQGAAQGAGSNWQSTQTVQPTPAQAPGYPHNDFTAANPFSSANPVIQPAPRGPSYPPGPQGPSYPPGPGPQGPPPRRSGGGGRALLIVVAVIVVLAAGGGAYALATSLGKHSTAQQPGTPTTGASTTGSATTGASAPASGAGSASTSPSVAPSPTLSLVAVDPGVGSNATEPLVETLLSHYFQGINTHSYAEYSSTLNAAAQAKQTQAQFNSGYSSTTDSGMTLTDLSSGSGGGLTATVTFTSHQLAAQSVDNSACNAWTLDLYLVPQGAGYLIGPAPSGYQPIYSDC
jgi:hypothetical protein